MGQLKWRLLVLALVPGLAWCPVASRLNITEVDGSPSTFPYKLKVTNGSLTDNGDGTASLSITGGPGGSGDAVLASTQVWTGGNTFRSSTTFTSTITVSGPTNLSGSFGNNGDVYTSGGAGAAPTWTTPAGTDTTALGVSTYTLALSTGILAASTGTLQTITFNLGVSTAALASSTGTLATSTGTLQSITNTLGVSTAAIAVSTGVLASSTGTLQSITFNLGVSTNALAVSTAAMSASTGALKSVDATLGASTASLAASTGTLATSTGSLQTVTFNLGVSTAALAVSTGSLSASTGAILATLSTAAFRNSTQTFTATQSFSTNTIMVGATFYQNGLVVMGSSISFMGGVDISSSVKFVGDPGTSGQFLKSNGPGTVPSWVTASGTGDAVLAATQTWTGGNTFTSSMTMTSTVTIRNVSTFTVDAVFLLSSVSSLTVSGAYMDVSAATTTMGPTRLSSSYGNSGDVYTSAGSGAAPTWTTPIDATLISNLGVSTAAIATSTGTLATGTGTLKTYINNVAASTFTLGQATGSLKSYADSIAQSTFSLAQATATFIKTTSSPTWTGIHAWSNPQSSTFTYGLFLGSANFTSAAPPQTPYPNGVVWNDSTQQSLRAAISGGTQTLGGTLYSVANSSAYFNAATNYGSLLSTSGIGGLMIPANFLTRGKNIYMVMMGTYTTTGVTTILSSVTLNGRAIMGSTGTMVVPTQTSTGVFKMESMISVRSTGAQGILTGDGMITFSTQTFTGTNNTIPMRSILDDVQSSTFNTTTDQYIDWVVKWGAANAANRMTVLHGFIDVKN